MKNMAVRKGQALVEFALVIVLLIFILSGLFDLGRAMMDYAILNTAVREGTRYAVTRGVNDSGIIPTIEGYYFKSIGLAANVSLPVITSGGTSSNPTVIIRISYNFEPFTPGLKLLFSDGIIPIDVQSEMLLAPNAK
jgi:hypothetical protein